MANNLAPVSPAKLFTLQALTRVLFQAGEDGCSIDELSEKYWEPFRGCSSETIITIEDEHIGTILDYKSKYSKRQILNEQPWVLAYKEAWLESKSTMELYQYARIACIAASRSTKPWTGGTRTRIVIANAFTPSEAGETGEAGEDIKDEDGQAATPSSGSTS